MTRPSSLSPLAAACLVALSAAAFGTMAIFARWAYAAGVDAYGVLMPRFVIAALLLWVILRRAGTTLPPASRLPGLTLMGLGYVAQSFCYFAALTYIPAGMVALLLYLYPLFVVLLARIVGHEPLSARKLLALAVCSVGTVLTLGVTGAAGPATDLALDWRGVALAVGAACIYSVYIVGGSRATHGLDPLASTTVILSSAAVALVLIVAVRWALGLPPRLPQSGPAWSAVLAIAVVSTAIAISLFVVGLRQLGASRTAVISTLEPVVTVVLAALFLQERLGFDQLVGGALVLAGALLLALHRPAEPAQEQAAASQGARR